MKFLPLAAIVILILAPDVASAAGFIPCDGANVKGLTACTECHFVQMGNTILKWLIGVLFVVFAVVAVMGGFGLVTSGGSPDALNQAKAKLTNAIIGIVIVLAAWLIVDTVMRGLLTGGNGEISGYGPWSKVECGSQSISVQGNEVGEILDQGGTPPDPDVTAECTDDAALKLKYSGSDIGVEAPGLREMINCYLADSTISSATDSGQLYTVDRSHPRCSLTNGDPVCEPCSHSNNSMHYGRGSGAGAKAVDFNATGVSEAELNSRLLARKNTCGGSIIFEANHTHISL